MYKEDKYISSFGQAYRSACHAPALQIGERLGRDAQVGAEKGRAQFGDQFLVGIAFVASTFVPEFAVEPCRVARPMTVNSCSKVA